MVFNSNAARQNFIVENSFSVAIGDLNGDFNPSPVTLAVEDGGGNELISFSALIQDASVLPISCDVMQQIVQPDNSPNIMLRISRDRGKTWGTEMWRKQSGNGKYVCRTRWTIGGAAFGIVPWFTFVGNQYVSFRSIRVYAEGAT